MLNEWSISSFITIAIAAFLAVVAFWAAFGPDHMLNDCSNNMGRGNWGEGAFWRAIYAMVGFGCIGAILAETKMHWATRMHRQISSTYAQRPGLVSQR